MFVRSNVNPIEQGYYRTAVRNEEAGNGNHQRGRGEARRQDQAGHHRSAVAHLIPAATESSEQFAGSSSTQSFSRTVSTERTTWRVARTERTVMARAAVARRRTAAETPAERARPASANSASAP